MSDGGEPAPARPAKSASAFRTIGEVAEDLDLPPHVLRFWEAKFPQLKPVKRGGGRRYYRPEDIALLRRIRQCLYQDGYTIRGVQKLLADAPRGPPDPEPMPSLFPLDSVAEAPPRRATSRSARPPSAPKQPDHRAALEEIRRQLVEAKALLGRLLKDGGSS